MVSFLYSLLSVRAVLFCLKYHAIHVLDVQCISAWCTTVTYCVIYMVLTLFIQTQSDVLVSRLFVYFELTMHV